MKFSIGIGITNKCNYNCSHCYSREGTEYELDFEQVKNICNNIEVTALNFGTGESGLHKDFVKIVDYVYEKGIKVALTTNGYTVSLLSDETLKKFNDIDFSLDFDDEKNHDAFRGKMASDAIIKGIERCKQLNVECSFACAMMKDNYKIMDKMVLKAREYDVNLRTNIYKPVHTTKHLLTYDEFWEGIDRLLKNSELISCSEPIVNAVINNKTLDGGSRCGKKSLRIRPDGGIVPCVYWNEKRTTIDELIDNKVKMDEEEFIDFIDDVTSETKQIPLECNDCEVLDVCQGGCAARRLYNDLDKPDPYCFKIQGKDKPKLDVKWGDSKDLVHSNYLCTIIVK